MKSLYQAILTRLADKAPSVLHTDLYNAQFEFTEQELPFRFPAVFVEFADIAWESLGSSSTHRHQRGNYVLRIYVAQEPYGDTDSDSIDRVRALEMFDVLDEVSTALMGFAPEGYSAFQRTRTTVQAVYGLLSVYAIEFATEGRECIEKVDKSYVEQMADLVVRGEVDEETDGVDSRPERPDSPFILPE